LWPITDTYPRRRVIHISDFCPQNWWPEWRPGPGSRHRHRMRGEGESLGETIGYLLAVGRARANLSQARLAERLGRSQQWLSRVESGTANMSLRTLQRLFAELGRQLRIEAEPVGADLDAEIDRGVRLSEDDRRIEVDLHRSLLRHLDSIPFAVAGRLAAYVQGAPLSSVSCIDVVVTHADLPALATLMHRTFCQRWKPQWEDWGYDPIDPRHPGPMRWWICGSDMRLRVVPRSPKTIAVRIADHTLHVVPLAEVERDDPWLRRLMNRWRVREGGPDTG
jgi:transcriptional regulator with XRE-family HTH domain